MFWRAWKIFSLLTGLSMDYYTPLEHRTHSFKEFMEEFINTQFIDQFRDFGLEPPLFDRRALEPMREVFARLARWEPYFDGARSVAQVAVVFSRHTQDNYGRGKPGPRYFDPVRGTYCALQEAHIPFDMLSDKFIDAARSRGSARARLRR